MRAPVPAAAPDAESVRGLQERTARALPAEEVVDAGGWWLRHAPNLSWWVGTVLPHGAAGPHELLDRVVAAEEFYASRGAAARFQISPSACPDGLDDLLAERGYRRESPVSLRAAPTAHVLDQASAGSLRVRLDERPTRPWFEVRQAVNGGDARAEREMLDRVDRPSAYASVSLDDGVVAVGRAVADAGWAGVFGMATLPRARGKGAARAVLTALAGWARAHDADRVYLQVVRDNRAAARLYERAGFRELCGYHYRTAGRHRPPAHR